MIPLTGYTDRLSARPGEKIEFKLSSVGPGPIRAHLVKVRCGDPNPAGPGIREKDLSDIFATSVPSRVQTHVIGSYAKAPRPAAAQGPITFEAVVWPTTTGKGEQGVLCCIGSDGLALVVAEDGSAGAVLQIGGQAVRLSTGRALRERRWYRIWASHDPEGQLSVGQVALDDPFGDARPVEAARKVSPGQPVFPDTLRLAVIEPNAGLGFYNGKIEAPGILDASGQVLARWDFAQDISGLSIRDTGPERRHGRIVNLPARGMKGSRWSGREMCWRHAPDEYAAIHFHDTDLDDCGWQTDLTFTVPDDLPSGIYGLRLSCGAETDMIPFFVPAPRGRRGADLCVLIPSFTYVVYGNFDRPDFSDAYRARAAELGMIPHFPGDHPEYGFSTYNRHSDGSGICHVSALRPMMTLRSGCLNQLDMVGSGMRHFGADTHLTDWLEAQGIAYDIVTDHEVHAEGVAAVAGYRTLLTLSHPEYHTAETLDALTAYRNSGGRFCYLGGNGFYWRVALHPEAAGAIEIRRGEGGIRAWAAEPGEYYNAFDGAYGGLWRRSGRAPQALAGAGFSSQGTFEGSYYRLLPAASDLRAAWIFDGIEEEMLGDYGLSGGGAAGFELDRADTRLGTPEHALVLARSEGHSERFVLVPEEQLTHLVTLPGEPAEDLIRAELVFFETPAGGAVFSVGSITFCGSLSHNGYENGISRMLGNVVMRFLDPAPFAMPEDGCKAALIARS
ncbi:MAG: N,N-dimethylformamidase beta subunit family domain-containing protein [Pseudomonadota bacterium]